MLFIGLLAILTAVKATFSSEAFVVDWVRTGTGIPLFVESPRDERYETDVIVATDLNAIARLSDHGEVIWRQVLPDESSTTAGLGVVDGVVLTGGSQILGWNASTGQLLWTVNELGKAVYADAVLDTGKGKFKVSASGKFEPFTGTQVESEPLVCDAGIVTITDHGVVQFTSHEGRLYWTRGEGLSDVVSACFVDVPDPDGKLNEIDWESGWWQRLQRHLNELKSYKWHFIDKSLLFGFRKYLVLVTSRGSVYGLDTEYRGKIVWVLHDLQAISVRSNGSVVELATANGDTLGLSWDGQLGGLVDSHQPEYDVRFEGDKVFGVKNGIRTWSFDAKAPIIALELRKPEVTASVGTVLPDGSVLYKYINPNLVAFAAYRNENLEVFLLDGISGRMVDSASHPDPVLIDGSHPFSLIMGEHWIVYSYYSQDETRTFKITVWDLYESGLPNVRKSKAEYISAFSTPDYSPKVFKETYIAPGRVGLLAASQTLFGVSIRDVIMFLPHEIAAIPKPMLSAIPQSLISSSAKVPARPTSLEILPQSHISHFYGLEGISDILVVPSHLESTYLLAAYGGLDIFFSRVAPSGDYDRLAATFPRFKLIVIVASLAIVALVLAPFAKQKRIAREWR